MVGLSNEEENPAKSREMWDNSKKTMATLFSFFPSLLLRPIFELFCFSIFTASKILSLPSQRREEKKRKQLKKDDMEWRKDESQLMHIFFHTTHSCHTRGSLNKTQRFARYPSLHVEGEEMPNQVGNQGLVLSVDAKPRLKWTRHLHERFIDAVAQLGGADRATPKSVMRLMGIPGLTLYHLKSHLQKYRLAKSGDISTIHDNKKQDCMVVDYSSAEKRTAHAEKDKTQPQFNEAMLQIQMEVQRKLQEQIEVQRHLQLRIEAQGKYLQSVLKKAQETLAGYSSNSMGVEAAKAELSELVSAVDTECFSSSFSQGSFVLKQTQNADCSTDSCLTSSDRPKMKDRKQQRLEASSCSYSWCEVSDEINPKPNGSKAVETESKRMACCNNPGKRTRNQTEHGGEGVTEEFDLNR